MVYCDNRYGSSTGLNYQYDKYFSQCNGKYEIFQKFLVTEEQSTDFQSIINKLNNYKF